MRVKPRIVPMGDSALLIQLGDEIDVATNQRIHRLSALISTSPFVGFIETVPAYTTLLIHYDPLTTSLAQVGRYARQKIAQIDDWTAQKPKQVDVPTIYGGDHGIDLDAVARHCGLHIEDVIRIHSETIYTVFMMGFTPGFPYMGKLEDAIVVPRLDRPRTQVKAGTVAIAGLQTGIYSIDSPGGWQLIGWTPLQLFSPESEMPFLFSPGDRVRFIPQ